MPLSAGYLRQLLHYDPLTGVFTWLPRRETVRQHKVFNQLYAGKPCGCLAKRGYVSVSIDDKQYWAHRLAWLYMTGAMPADQIDHANGVKDDNRWCNLRAATARENGRNVPSHSESGLKGVSIAGRRWRAKMCFDGRHVHLGVFDTPEAAHAAYCAAARKAYGAFARFA